MLLISIKMNHRRPAWVGYDPVVFTWPDLPVSHKMNQMFDQFSFEYEVEFLDCPADVKAERELKWGMKDGGCSTPKRQPVGQGYRILRST